ncbi:DUF262 domain-containing protein [Oryzobacter sp. R7]|uniref:DUF262 domain-containing protein n=1 Tax=Oryzobacter faecalis TaxID=3388656 RepID=UPI00398CA531
MLGNPAKIANVLNASSAYRIPPYQRAYQWDKERWQGLAHDVFQLTSKPAGEPPHWLGILLLSEDGGVVFPGDDSIRTYTVIDGQQRLTTSILWLAAIAHHAADIQDPITMDVGKFAHVDVQEIDKLPFKVALEGKWRQARYARLLETRPLQAYAYFRWLLFLGNDALLEEEPMKAIQLRPAKDAGVFEEQWNKFLSSKRAVGVPRGPKVDCDVLAKTTRNEMSVFSLIHDPNTDESQATIFDTLNGMRTPLEPLDHVRNSLFVRLPEEKARALYESEWKVTEDAVRRVRMKRMAAEKMFLYDYLIARGEKARQKTINANRGAAHFSVMTRGLKGKALISLLKDDLLPAMATWPIVVRQADRYRHAGVTVAFPETTLRLLTSIQDLSTNPANPIALHFASEFALGNVSEDELESALFFAEAYLARQLLAGRALSPLRSRVMEVMGKLNRSVDPNDLLTELMNSAWPTDDEIRSVAASKPLYLDLSSRAVVALLRGIESELSGSGAMFFRAGSGRGDYTIEHIFPQKHGTWAHDLAAWNADEAQMGHLLHSLGNLAVVTPSHNSTVGNGTFADKKRHPTKTGKAAPLALNASWLRKRKWTQTEIAARADLLVETAIAHWSP